MNPAYRGPVVSGFGETETDEAGVATTTSTYSVFLDPQSRGTNEADPKRPCHLLLLRIHNQSEKYTVPGVLENPGRHQQPGSSPSILARCPEYSRFGLCLFGDAIPDSFAKQWPHAHTQGAQVRRLPAP